MARLQQANLEFDLNRRLELVARCTRPVLDLCSKNEKEHSLLRKCHNHKRNNEIVEFHFGARSQM